MTMCEVGNLSAQVSAATYPGKRKKKRKKVLRKQITVVDVRTLTPPPDKLTLRHDPPQYVSTGNSITLPVNFSRFPVWQLEKGKLPVAMGSPRCPSRDAGTGRWSRRWCRDRSGLMDVPTWQIHNPKPHAAVRKLMASRDRGGPRANTCLLHHKLMALNTKKKSWLLFTSCQSNSFFWYRPPAASSASSGTEGH